MRFLSVIPLILVILFGVYKAATFTVQVDQTAVLTMLGKPVKEYTTPGIRFKIPFANQVIYFSKKLIEYDAPPSEIITNDKKNLVIDNFNSTSQLEVTAKRLTDSTTSSIPR
jgi:membrane protease subunit HflC